jgi:hypothetical protein
MAEVVAMRRTSRRGSRPCRAFWVAFAGEGWLTCPLTLRLGNGKQALALFSHEEEAEVFLRSSESAGRDWRARETSVGEVVLLLYGPYCGATGVVIDPLPEMLTDGFLGLVSLERRRFVRWATGRERDPTPPDAA